MKYELVYIIDPDVDEETRKALIERFGAMIESNGGTVEKTDEWGKRHLAYPIEKKDEGIYVVLDLKCEPAAVLELDRRLNLNDSILRTKVLRGDR